MLSQNDTFTVTYEDFERIYKMFAEYGTPEEVVDFLMTMTAIVKPDTSYDECALYALTIIADAVRSDS